MIIFSTACIFFVISELLAVSARSLHDVCDVLKIDNPVACDANKVSNLSIQEYQRVINYLELLEDNSVDIVLLEEIYYYYGLRLSFEPNSHNELDTISQWEKIHETNYLIKLKEKKLDELYLKFGDFDKIKTNEFKDIIVNFDKLNIDEQLLISPYNYNLLLSKNLFLWDELEKSTQNGISYENEEDKMIILATELSSNYQVVLNKYKKRLSLNEKAKYFALLADIEFLILNNFKKSILFAKNCVEFNESNKHCLNLIKLSNKIVKNKNCSPKDGLFDHLEYNTELNQKWAKDFISMINDKKGKNVFTILDKNAYDYYTLNEESMFKKIYKDSPYNDLLQIWKIISNDLIQSSKQQKVSKNKVKSILKIIKIDKLSSVAGLFKSFDEDLLNKIWNNKSPYLCLNLIEYLIESKEFQTKKTSLDIKKIAKFLQDKNLINLNEYELDPFSRNIMREIKIQKHQDEINDQKIRQQQQNQFFQQHFQQQAGGQHFQGFNGNGQHFQQQQHQQQQPPPHQKFAKEKDYYKILKVDPNASNKEIRKSYLGMIKQYHPDKLQNLSEKEEAKMENLVHNLNEAYEVLYDDEQRREYDVFRSGRW
ncbi:hypothetical protein QEN19_003244 [Hanseniaspora menglaensis]